MNTSIFYLDEEVTIGAFAMFVFSFYTGILALELFFKSNLRKCKYLIWTNIFWLLALDEYFSIHEYLNHLLKLSFGLSSEVSKLASRSWVLTVGVLFLIPINYIFYQIFKEKNKNIKYLLLLGIFSYIFVLIIEYIGGGFYGQKIYITFVGMEEGMELIGTLFFMEAFKQKTKLNDI